MIDNEDSITIVIKGNRVEKRYKNSNIKIVTITSNDFKTEEYYKDDKLHRDNYLPAIIKFDEDGKIISEEYFQNGKHYTIDG